MASNKDNRIKAKCMTLFALELVRKGYEPKDVMKTTEDFYNKVIAQTNTLDEALNYARKEYDQKLAKAAEMLEVAKAQLKTSDENIGKFAKRCETLEKDKAEMLEELESRNERILELKSQRTHCDAINQDFRNTIVMKDKALEIREAEIKTLKIRVQAVSDAQDAVQILKQENSKLLDQLKVANRNINLLEDKANLANRDCTTLAKQFEKDQDEIKALKALIQGYENKLSKITTDVNEQGKGESVISKLQRENFKLLAKIDSLERLLETPIAPTVERQDPGNCEDRESFPPIPENGAEILPPCKSVVNKELLNQSLPLDDSIDEDKLYQAEPEEKEDGDDKPRKKYYYKEEKPRKRSDGRRT